MGWLLGKLEKLGKLGKLGWGPCRLLFPCSVGLCVFMVFCTGRACHIDGVSSSRHPEQTFFALLGKSWPQRPHSFGNPRNPRHHEFFFTSVRFQHPNITACSTCGAPPVLDHARAKRQTATQHMHHAHGATDSPLRPCSIWEFGKMQKQNPGTKEARKQARRQSINEKKRRMAWLLKIKNVNDLGGACPRFELATTNTPP